MLFPLRAVFFYIDRGWSCECGVFESVKVNVSVKKIVVRSVGVVSGITVEDIVESVEVYVSFAVDDLIKSIEVGVAFEDVVESVQATI